MNVLSLSDGISAPRIALRKAGIPVTNYYSSESDRFAISVSRENWTGITYLGGMNNWREWKINWAGIDLVIITNPCAGFTISDERISFQDPKAKAFFQFHDILMHTRDFNPKVRFLMENTRMNKQHRGIVSNLLGVAPILIDSQLLSAQSRKRYYWCNWNVVQPHDTNQLMHTIVQNGTPHRDKSQTILPTIYKENAKSMVKRNKWGLLIKTTKGNRKLTPIECERLQNIPDNYTKILSKTQRYKTVGNSPTVDVIAHILVQIH